MMRTVSGKVISTAPISLSKAASIISNFAAAENGASQAISAYVRRASAAFSELAHLHRELKHSPMSSRKQKLPKPDVSQEQNPPTMIDAGGEPSYLAELSQKRSQRAVENIEGKKHSKKKKKENRESGDFVENEGENAGIKFEIETKEKLILLGGGEPSHGVEDHEGVDRERKRHKKKKKERGEFGNFVENKGESAGIIKFETETEERLIPLGGGEPSHGVEGHEGVDSERKKHKKKKIKNERDYNEVENSKFEENCDRIGKTQDEVKMEIVAERREAKKNKGEEAHEGEDLGSEERPRKKKRRRKSEELRNNA